MSPDHAVVQRTRDTQCPRERPPTLGPVETLRPRVHPGTATGEAPARVRDQGPVHRDDTQQTGGLLPGPTPDARADGSRFPETGRGRV